ncbi:hypothetical protein RND81_06G086600 [Saponaria officinalis]|uniref:X8 domain-containing protein n=1 Tax=Saponaria officinalis TaxID=3572 RepID=A0AAW1KBF7_SAPOF
MILKVLFLKSFFILACYEIGYTNGEAQVLEKNEATVPQTTLSPPEGNTTFMGGTSWCVALSGASQSELQLTLDWACGSGNADCGPIQAGGPCFEPNTLASHASYAFNSYFQQNGNNEVACRFGGTATLTQHDPSNFFNLLLILFSYKPPTN